MPQVDSLYVWVILDLHWERRLPTFAAALMNGATQRR